MFREIYIHNTSSDLIQKDLNARVSYHPQSRWLDVVRRCMADTGKSASVLSMLNLHPAAKHPVRFTRIIGCMSQAAIGCRPGRETGASFSMTSNA